MNIILKTFTIVLTVFLMGCDRQNARVVNWDVYVNDGKSDKISFDYSSNTISFDEYFEFLRKICYWDVVNDPNGTVTESDREPYLAKNLTVTKIGLWSGYEVLDITNKSIKHKSIALIDNHGKIFIPYIQFFDSTADVVDLPKIIKIQDSELLTYITRVPGTGNQYIEIYYKFDNQTKIPILLDLSDIEVEIKKVIPSGFGIWKGGGLDLQNLQYSQNVWKPNDANCCPTGGSINLGLSIQGNRVVVVDSHYNQESTY